MNIKDQAVVENSNYEPIFSYGHLRANYVGSSMPDGVLSISQFVRIEHIEALRHDLLIDHKILASANAMLLRDITPITRQCLWELQSGIMLRVLENITGLHNLLPDTRCKQTRVLYSSDSTYKSCPTLDPDTNLQASLRLFIRLDSGDALFSVALDKPDDMRCDHGILCATYWQHQPESTELPS